MSRLGSNHLKGFTKNAVKAGDTYSAIDFLVEYCTRNPEDIGSIYRLAELYRHVRDYESASVCYKKVIDEQDVNYPLSRFYYAKMLKMMGNYDAAMINFSDFKKKAKGVPDDALFKKLQKIEVDGIEYARKIGERQKDIYILHLDRTVNNNHVDMSPLILSNNSFMYASLWLDTLKYYVTGDTGQKVPVRQFYLAKRSGDTWMGLGLAGSYPFNNPDVNSCNGAMSPDGKRFYFTRCLKSWKGETLCNIYVSRHENDGWTEPTEVVELSDPQFTTTQPTVGTESRTGVEVLYFSSNRIGGKGGFDIWSAIYNQKTGYFNPPKNCGSTINSVGDEITPWYDMQTRTMYFSSDGFPGVGGLDIFKTIGETKSWQAPENYGTPINSCTDDLYFTLMPTRDEGFIVSNRPGGFSHRSPTCCDDIYNFRLLSYIKIGVTGKVLAIQDSSIYKILEQRLDTSQNVGEIEEDEMIEPAKGAIINLFWNNEDTKTDIFIARDTINDDGTYFFTLEAEKKYKLIVENFGFFNKTLNTNTVGITRSDTIRLDAIYINKIPLEPLIVKNIYYEFAKADLTDDSKKVIDSTIFRIMSENPTIVVEIRSHTDSVSSAGFNLKLSQKRAESVVEYLISKGIVKDRLLAKGFGKNMPIAKNSNPDGSDNPEGRAKNRRTEFRIVGSLDQYSDIKYVE